MRAVSATCEITTVIVRVGPGHEKHGDDYEFIAVGVGGDGVLKLKGLSKGRQERLTVVHWRAVKRVLAEHGLVIEGWDRMKRGKKRSVAAKGKSLDEESQVRATKEDQQQDQGCSR